MKWENPIQKKLQSLCLDLSFSFPLLPEFLSVDRTYCRVILGPSEHRFLCQNQTYLISLSEQIWAHQIHLFLIWKLSHLLHPHYSLLRPSIRNLRYTLHWKRSCFKSLLRLWHCFRTSTVQATISWVSFCLNSIFYGTFATSLKF